MTLSHFPCNLSRNFVALLPPLEIQGGDVDSGGKDKVKTGRRKFGEQKPWADSGGEKDVEMGGKNICEVN